VTEEEAQAHLCEDHDVSRGTLDRLSAFADLLRAEAERQNLIARGTFDQIWSRHILDSAQLLRFAPSNAKTWLDLGTGAGFPGLIVAALHPAHVICVESRKLRVEWLTRAADALGVQHKVDLICAKLEQVPTRTADVISARAFAPLDRLLALAERFGSRETRWVLPKGRNAHVELASVAVTWQGEFRLEPSLTDPDAQIIVADQVRRRGKGSR
jgi:16S rRNA (guanine527-N7)-methyltransferase